jgi:hypothetical protein
VAIDDLSDHWLSQAFLQLVESFGGTAEASLSASIEGRNDSRFGMGAFAARLNGLGFR